MGTTISARGFVRKELERDVRGYAKHMLGRLRHQIAHAELALEKENEEVVGGVHVCTLRLRLHKASDVRVLVRGTDVCGALTGAFRRARYELLRRRRKTSVSPGPRPALS